MGKKNKHKRDLPTVEKMGEMGFQDGYSGIKSKEDEILKSYSKRRINADQIKIRVLAYCLGYKKGQLVLENGVNNFKIINGEIAINGKPIMLDENKINMIEQKIKEEEKPVIKKKRR